ncbi:MULTISPECIES: putative Na+/H+ antiporter [unclassified Fusibacter]|uniref:putative Na+/H+ antiporter n=1 Tax=unclassified Fusibacter TaxID=2624464 RepID=UPI001FA992C9|nr:putative Na+/H+ antiporter [Fusibacter sp. A1]MCK8060432.1 putative Na+/H+ antiporter [Fusibacter sp. A2]
MSAFYQNRMDLKPALMVAFFLSGLVVHGGLQGWWIQPVLSNLSEGPLHVVAIVLTSFNDNASITYLSSLVPSLTDSMKYAVVAGAVTGGGLTLIANSPNPIAQSLLKHHFKNGISAAWLVLYALPLTVIASLCFMLF